MNKKLSCLLLFISLCSFSLSANKVEDIYEKEIIHVGVRYEHEPLAFINKHGKIDGFEIDLVRFLANKLNVQVKFHQVNSKNRIQFLKEDKVDFIIASMDRKNTLGVDYTKEYFFDNTVLLTNINNEATHLSDFRNKIIATIKSELTDKFLLKKFPEARVVYFAEYPQAIRSLDRDNITATLVDQSWASKMQEKYLDKFKIISTNLYSLHYVIAVKKGENELITLLNKALYDSIHEGIYQETYKKWFKKEIDVLPKIKDK